MALDFDTFAQSLKISSKFSKKENEWITIAKVLIFTGVKLKEFTAILLMDCKYDPKIDPDFVQITIRNSKGKPRVVSMPKDTFNYLRAIRPFGSTHLLSHNHNGKIRPYTPRAIEGIIRKVGDMFDTQGLTPYQIRQEAVKSSIKNGHSKKALLKYYGLTEAKFQQLATEAYSALEEK